MNAVQVIQQSAATSDMVVKAYLGDLEDTDLLKRPHADCNHIAWQLGHLITSEVNLLTALNADAAPELPEGFAEKHSRSTTGSDDPADFYSKEEYLALFDKVRAATHAALDKVTEAELEAECPIEAFREMFPTVGSVYVLIANHPMMHAGQWVPVRRGAGKPVVI